MKNKVVKVILWSVLIIFILFCVFIGSLVVKDLKQEDDLRDNIKEINDMFSQDDLDVDKINKSLKSYVTTGENLMLEKVVKKYYSDAFELVLDTNDVLRDKRITNLLSNENILNDAPDFTYSKKYIENTINILNESVEKVKDFQTEENIISYYKDAKIDSYYKDLYIELTSMFNYFGDSKDYENDIDKLISQLEAINDILDFLKENYGRWTIVDGSYYFENEDLLMKFKELLSKVDYYNEEEKNYESIKY
ncbi:MAG TPA: hypothetical protein IAB68_03440 [Candidatus Aphodocola excrementigallinarum]|uniref:Uncharacterized protein n=1 Tax=Candidatus Aphodocola excrementigallinarum TaxID=2840670 RepID=A0A9D1LIV1_9FIRM|nr:hypothetical protein [Candidatus Aphodocola excrementigallinarum]